MGRPQWRPIHLPERGSNMSEAQKSETLARALRAALVHLGVGTAVFEPDELAAAEEYKLRCRHQIDGSVAVILDLTA